MFTPFKPPVKIKVGELLDGQKNMLPYILTLLEETLQAENREVSLDSIDKIFGFGDKSKLEVKIGYVDKSGAFTESQAMLKDKSRDDFLDISEVGKRAEDFALQVLINSKKNNPMADAVGESRLATDSGVRLVDDFTVGGDPTLIIIGQRSITNLNTHMKNHKINTDNIKLNPSHTVYEPGSKKMKTPAFTPEASRKVPNPRSPKDLLKLAREQAKQANAKSRKDFQHKRNPGDKGGRTGK